MTAHYQRFFYRDYDLDDDEFKYGAYSGLQAQGRGTMSTDGSSTTIAIADSGGAPLGVGDYLEIYDGETLHERRVVTPGVSSIVVNAAIDLDGTPAWHFRKFRIGTADTDGWVRTRHRSDAAIIVEWLTKAADGLDISIEMRAPTGTPVPILTRSYAAVVLDTIALGSDAGQSVRVGVKAAATFNGVAEEEPADDEEKELAAKPKVGTPPPPPHSTKLGLSYTINLNLPAAIAPTLRSSRAWSPRSRG